MPKEKGGKVFVVDKPGFLIRGRYRGVDADGRMRDTTSRKAAERFASAGSTKRLLRRILDS